MRTFDRGEPTQFNDELLQENWASRGSEVVCTVKNYKIANGLSERLHKLNSNDLYQVKGLMGKGLGIN